MISNKSFFHLLFSAFFLLICHTTTAQRTTEEFFLSRDHAKSFDSVAKYTIAIIEKDGKYGLMNQLGEWFLQPVYDEIRSKSEGNGKIPSWTDGVLVVRKGNKFGAVNCFGKDILPCEYSDVYYGHGIFTLKNLAGKYAQADRTGKLISKFQTRYPGSFETGLSTIFLDPPKEADYTFDNDPKSSYGLVNLKGDTVLTVRDVRYMIDPFETSEGFTAFNMYPLIPGGLGHNKGSLFFVNSRGEMFVEPDYPSAFIYGFPKSASSWQHKPAFHQGRALLFVGDTAVYIDTNGKIAIDFKDRLQKVYAQNDFNEHGFALIHYSIWKERYRPVYEVIDTSGKPILKLHPDEYIGNGGIVIESLKDFDFVTVSGPYGMSIYNKEMQQTFFAPYQDEDYKYFNSSSYIAGLRIVRESKITKEAEYTYADWEGNFNYPWMPVTVYFDPLTNITFTRKGTGLEMRNSSQEVNFTCDSCYLDDLNNLKEYRNAGYNASGGLYEIRRTGYGHYDPQNLIGVMNYKGELILGKNAKLKPVFSNFAAEIKKYAKEYEVVKISFTQKELDELYKSMSWNPANKIRKKPVQGN